MKNSHILGVLIGILSLSLQAQSPDIDWFVLNDAGHRISPAFLEVDRTGNSYVVGQYWGETMFRSADGSGKTFHTYTGEQLGKIFISQYDPDGACRFLVKMRSPSNDYLAPSGFQLLADGRLVLAAYTASGIIVEDATGETYTARCRDQIMLLFFSPEGIFLSSMPLPLKQLDKFAESKAGKLYFMGIKKSYSKEISGIFFLENGGSELQQLALSDLPITDFHLLGDRLWFLVSGKKKEPGHRLQQFFELSSLDEKTLSSLPKKHFSRSFEGHAFAATQLIEAGGRLEVALRISVIHPSRFRFEAEQDKPFAHHALFIYTTAGDVTYFADFNQLYVQQFNLQGRKDGGYYATALPQQTFKLAGQDSIPARAHNAHTFEKIILAFDENMALESYFFAGGANSQDTQIALRESKGKILYASQMADFGYFGEAYKELNWRAGFYLMRFVPKE